jgi:chromosome segregation ATPase
VSKTGDEAALVKRSAETATAELQQSLKQQRERAETLEGELAKARGQVETQVALASKSGDEAAKFNRAAETAMAELQQSLHQQRDRALALESELAMARREVATATSRKMDDESAPLKRPPPHRQNGGARGRACRARHPPPPPR